MFKKALIVDNQPIINHGVVTVLKSLGVPNVYKTLYCDDALLKVKKAKLEKQPFDLVITSIDFKEDNRVSTLKSGINLVEKLRLDYDPLAIIIFSKEDHFQVVRTLINKLGANGYIWKGRDGDKELEKAVKEVFNGKQFLSNHIERALHQKEDAEITDYDIVLVKQLSLGLSQLEISIYFREQNIYPSSISSVEKRLNKLKDHFKANNSIHLVTLMKNAKLI